MTTNTFYPSIIPRIAEALDPDRKQAGWWYFRPEPTSVKIAKRQTIYTGPTTPAAAKAAFEPLVRGTRSAERLLTYLREAMLVDIANEDVIPAMRWILFDMTAKQWLAALARALEVE